MFDFQSFLFYFFIFYFFQLHALTSGVALF
jgi:hypothetical protein